jgi:orotidine-5'-phosphate decarboxylase
MPPLSLPLRDRLIVALDVPTIDQAEALVVTLGDSIGFYKIGMELAYIGGIPFGARLIAAGKQVFFDLKLHDIPNTVERATAQIATTGATFMTVHAYPQTLEAAVTAARGSSLGILGVSVLTSMDDADCARAGYGSGVEPLVRLRARQTAEAGAAGIVCAPTDVRIVRDVVSDGAEIITPGIRPASVAGHDQKRMMTPGDAMRGGVTRIVVGRAITTAADPLAASLAILDDMQSGMTG